MAASDKKLSQPPLIRPQKDVHRTLQIFFVLPGQGATILC